MLRNASAETGLADRWRKRRLRAGGQCRTRSPPRMSVPTRPASSAKTGPAHAPIKTQIAAPENQVTSARATPKKPNWASFLVTTSGIQIVADTANPAIAMPVITPVGSSTRGAHVAEQEEPGGEPPQPGRHGQRHDGEEAESEPTAERAAQTAEQRHADQYHQQPGRSPPVARRLRRAGGRRHARRYTRCSAVVNEVAKKIVSTQTEQAGRLPDVVRRREGFPGQRERVSPDAESGRDGGDDRRTDALGHEGGDDDHQREERDERLPGERDAAIDELDLEHALPHPPQEQPLQPRPQYGDALSHLDASEREGGVRLSPSRGCTSAPPGCVLSLHR